MAFFESPLPLSFVMLCTHSVYSYNSFCVHIVCEALFWAQNSLERHISLGTQTAYHSSPDNLHEEDCGVRLAFVVNAKPSKHVINDCPTNAMISTESNQFCSFPAQNWVISCYRSLLPTEITVCSKYNISMSFIFIQFIHKKAFSPIF